MNDINPTKHVLVPKHTILSDDETKELLVRYNVVKKQIPSISVKDPAIQHLNATVGHVIKIIRPSPTQGTSIFYRVVT